MYNDLDEVPIAGVKKTFEELLLEKMQEEAYLPVQKREVPKKEFLRRKSNPPTEYRVGKYEEFEEKGGSEEKSLCFVKEKPVVPKMKKPSPSVQIEYSQNKTPEPGKKNFLKRGEGKSCLTKKEKKEQKQKKSVGNKGGFDTNKVYLSTQEDRPDIPKKSVGNSGNKGGFDTHKVLISTQDDRPDLQKGRKLVEEARKTPQLPPANKTKEESIYYDPTALSCEQTDLVKPAKSPIKSKTSEIYNEKLNELNAQVERFKQQALMLKSENKELKQQIEAVDQELSEFSERKSRRMQDLRELKESELKRMKKERLEIEKNMKNVEYKKSEELEEMRTLLFKVQEELTIKEFKDKDNLEALTEELGKVNNEIGELEAQVKIREQLMLKEKFSKPPTKHPTEKVYQNGTRVKNYPDGKKVIYFTNGDIKETHPDGKVIYMYNEDQITEITLPDGTSICEFSNGQTEKTFPNGAKEITFPDGTTQIIK